MPALVAEIAAGATVLLVSDAGMPLISDPGYRLVAACIDAGAAGALPARSVCGDDGVGGVRACRRRSSASRDSPRASTRRGCPGWRRWRRAAHVRVLRVAAAAGGRACATPSRRWVPTAQAVVCRELTKTHEEIVRGSLAELADWAADGVLGEITVVLAGAHADTPTWRRWLPRSPSSSTRACGSRTRAPR